MLRCLRSLLFPHFLKMMERRNIKKSLLWINLKSLSRWFCFPVLCRVFYFAILHSPLHRGAFCQFPFRLIYYRSDKTVSRLARCRFSQKMNERIWFFFCFFAFHGKKNKFVCSFFRRIYDAPICFRFYLAFRSQW